MSWRWRRVINLGGGIRTNMSRAGIGWSWGIPGFRIGKGANGSTWISVGLPGTGLYFIKRLKKNPKQTGPAPQVEGEIDLLKNQPLIKEWKDLK